MKKLVIVALCGLLLTGCVSKQEYNALDAAYRSESDVSARLEEENLKLTQENEQLQKDYNSLRSRYDELLQDYNELIRPEEPETVPSTTAQTTTAPKIEFNPSYITMTEYNRISTGMTYEEVKEIIGGSGELLSETDLGLGAEYVSKMYCWYGEDGISNACLMFQGGELISKSQIGL